MLRTIRRLGAVMLVSGAVIASGCNLFGSGGTSPFGSLANVGNVGNADNDAEVADDVSASQPASQPSDGDGETSDDASPTQPNSAG